MMKNWTKVISVLIVIAVVMSMGTVALAVGISSTEEMVLIGFNNASVTQATNRYFTERNAYLLGKTDAMDWLVTGIVSDEAAHKAQFAEKNIVLSGISYTIDTVACFDTHAEVSVTESVSYVKNGTAGNEQVLHTLILYLDAENVPVVADDQYKELFSAFKSCSYIGTVESYSTTSLGGGSLCIVEIAKGELGVAETGDNITKYGAWYGLNGEPWCAMFVAWCANEARVSTSIIKKTASCTDMCSQFKSQGKFMNSAANSGNYTPVAGDIIFFGAGNTMTHVGIVATVQNGKVWFYDGNHTSEVTYRYYSLTASGIGGYGHPAYESISHAYGEHECDEDAHWQKCTVCEYVSSRENHYASNTYSFDVDTHWNPCGACGIKMNEAPHIRVDLGYGQYKCRICDCSIFPELDIDKIEIEIIGG